MTCARIEAAPVVRQPHPALPPPVLTCLMISLGGHFSTLGIPVPVAFFTPSRCSSSVMAASQAVSALSTWRTHHAVGESLALVLMWDGFFGPGQGLKGLQRSCIFERDQQARSL